MLNNIENIFRKTGRDGLADIIKGVRSTLGKDIPFPPTKERVSTLEVAAEMYKENPNSPECLTELMRSYWVEADEKSGKTTFVPEFPLKSKEIKERAKQKQMAVFNGKDWVWIEKSVDAPNLGTNEYQLREKIEKNGRQIMSLETYETGGRIHELLSGKYFDEEVTGSRVIRNDQVAASAYFLFDGYLSVDPYLHPEFGYEDLGGRFEELIKKPIK